VVQRLFVWISRRLPIRPVGQLKAEAPDRGNARTRRSDVNGLGAGKLVWVKVLALEPEGPQDEEDFALGVHPHRRRCCAHGIVSGVYGHGLNAARERMVSDFDSVVVLRHYGTDVIMKSWFNKSRACVKSADMKFGNDHIFDMASIDEGWDVVEKMSWSGVWIDLRGLAFYFGQVQFWISINEPAVVE
jgi:hypothetical protein